MLFNSIEFLLFLPTVVALFWALRRSVPLQNAFLLCASYFFYGWWDVRFLFLIAITTVVDYNTALLLDRGVTTARQRLISVLYLGLAFAIFLAPDYWQELESAGVIPGLAAVMFFILAIIFGPGLLAGQSEAVRRRWIVGFSITTNLGILGFFKYFNFFAASFSDMYATVFGTPPSIVTLMIVLPVGISFYTFQSMSYTIDVYRKQLPATPNIIEFASYLSFFPQLVAGPIERGKSLLPQFQRRKQFDGKQFTEGLWLIAWGLFKKVVIADNLALLVNAAFAAYDEGTAQGLHIEGGFYALIAVYAFAFQIYADFSGYSDIARGCAKLMGFELMLNFRLPYIATNPSDFWLRWHISLSSWLRDYLYIPLGGNRLGKFNTYRNLWLTMLLGGLWHGAAWTFVLWGFYQGLILVIYRLLGLENAGAKSTGLSKFFHIAWMFQLTCLGWLIFRAQNLETISLFLQSIFLDMRVSAAALTALGDLCFYIAPLLAVQAVQLWYQKLYFLPKLHWLASLNLWAFLVMGILAFSIGTRSEFIYFAF